MIEGPAGEVKVTPSVTKGGKLQPQQVQAVGTAPDSRAHRNNRRTNVELVVLSHCNKADALRQGSHRHSRRGACTWYWFLALLTVTGVTM